MFASFVLAVIEAIFSHQVFFSLEQKYSLYSLLLLFSCFGSIFILNTCKKPHQRNYYLSDWNATILSITWPCGLFISVYQSLTKNFHRKYSTNKSVRPNGLSLSLILYRMQLKEETLQNGLYFRFKLFISLDEFVLTTDKLLIWGPRVHVLLRIELNNVCACGDFATKQSSVTEKKSFDRLFHHDNMEIHFPCEERACLMCNLSNEFVQILSRPDLNAMFGVNARYRNAM